LIGCLPFAAYRKVDMKQFLLSKKFWLPWAMLLILGCVLEVSSRVGWLDGFISPKTYIGKAIFRYRALQNFGFENVNMISLGDSSLDWGLDHGEIKAKLFKAQQKNYIRFTFEQSGFLAIQSTAEWAIDHLPNLEHIVIGFDGRKIEPKGTARQIMVAMPFNQYLDFDNYHYAELEKPWLKWLRHLDLYWYFHEIKGWFNNPIETRRVRHKYLTNNWPKIWQKRHVRTQNVCAYKTDSLKSCYQTMLQLKSKKTQQSQFEKMLIKQCGSRYARLQLINPHAGQRITPEEQALWTENWLTLFKKITDNHIKLTVLLLPESHINTVLNTPRNAAEFIDHLMHQTRQLDYTKVVDLRALFTNNSDQQLCEYFTDFMHYNNEGLELLTAQFLQAIGIESIEPGP